MSDLPTSDPAGQPCTGQDGGHALPGEGRQRFRASISPTDPAIYLQALQALEGERCAGTFRVAEPSNGLDISFHAVRLAVLALPPFPAAPNAQIVILRHADNSVHDYAIGFDGLPANHAERILAGWRTAFPHSKQGQYQLAPTAGEQPKRTKPWMSMEQEQDITAVIRTMKGSGKPDKEIIAFLNTTYPEDDFGHKWNRMTIWRWLNDPDRM